MKKSMIKPVSIICALLIAAGGTGIGVYAANSSEEREQAVQAGGTIKEKDGGEEKDGRNLKDETVYVLASAEGKPQKIIVSDWLKNTLNSSEIADSSELSDIENVKGDESFSEKDGVKKWNAGGNDVYYMGVSEKELPVKAQVTYTLDGRAVSPEELKGQSGKVVIRYSFVNEQKTTVDGKEMYVPFAVLTGVILDNDIFTDVEVTNGRLINDGDKTVVAGFALPGLRENLGIDEEKLNIPEYVEISAKVSGFELSETVTVVTNEVFNNIEFDADSDISGLSDSLNQLSDAADQLCGGSEALYEGLTELSEKTAALTDGAGSLNDGALALSGGLEELGGGIDGLKTGAESLNNGLSDLKSGAEELNGGLDTLSQSSEMLNQGSKQVFDSLLSASYAQLTSAGLEIPQLTAENYAEVLDGAAAQLDESIARAQAAQMEEAARQAAAAKAGITAAKTQLDAYNEFYFGLIRYTAGVDQAAQGAAALSRGAAEAESGAAALSDGAGRLRDGAAQLRSGAAQLADGTAALKESIPALIEGIGQLKDGSKELSDGMKKFTEEGIQRLIDAAEGDLEGLLDNLKASKTAAEEYNSFSGINGDMDGQVKFIYRTEAIK